MTIFGLHIYTGFWCYFSGYLPPIIFGSNWLPEPKHRGQQVGDFKTNGHPDLQGRIWVLCSDCNLYLGEGFLDQDELQKM